MRGIHRWPMDAPYKGSVTRKCFHFRDVIMFASRGLYHDPIWIGKRLFPIHRKKTMEKYNFSDKPHWCTYCHIKTLIRYYSISWSTCFSVCVFYNRKISNNGYTNIARQLFSSKCWTKPGACIILVIRRDVDPLPHGGRGLILDMIQDWHST